MPWSLMGARRPLTAIIIPSTAFVDLTPPNPQPIGLDLRGPINVLKDWRCDYGILDSLPHSGDCHVACGNVIRLLETVKLTLEV